MIFSPRRGGNGKLNSQGNGKQISYGLRYPVRPKKTFRRQGHSKGSIPLFLLTGALTILGVIAISLIVAGVLRTIFELMTVGVFPFFILMFFSECMFPLPRFTLAKLAGHVYYVNDLLPTSLAVKAFNKILNFDAGLKDIGFELIGILILTAVYFGVGLWFFYRRHLRPR